MLRSGIIQWIVTETAEAPSQVLYARCEGREVIKIVRGRKDDDETSQWLLFCLHVLHPSNIVQETWV